MSLLCKGLPSAFIITAKVACLKVGGAVALERPRDGDVEDVMAAGGGGVMMVVVRIAVAAVVVRGREEETRRKAESPRIMTDYDGCCCGCVTAVFVL
jgi:hypothetical protein